ncbi:flocculation protein FLO11 [Gracilaria domingensis]|nr:flocculation protein FLO11 [Gracilaria domingensis]
MLSGDPDGLIETTNDGARLELVVAEMLSKSANKLTDGLVDISTFGAADDASVPSEGLEKGANAALDIGASDMISVASEGEAISILLPEGEVVGVEDISRTAGADALTMGSLLALGVWMIAPNEIDGVTDIAKGIPDKDKLVLVLGASDTISIMLEGATNSRVLAEADGVGVAELSKTTVADVLGTPGLPAFGAVGSLADPRALIDAPTDALTLGTAEILLKLTLKLADGPTETPTLAVEDVVSDELTEGLVDTPMLVK